VAANKANRKKRTSRTAIVKIGSAVSVDPEGATRKGLMRRLGGEIGELLEDDWSLILVLSGAVSRGKAVRGLEQIKELPVADLQAVSAIGQGYLFREAAESFQEAGVKTGQMLLTFSEVSNRESYPRVRAALRTLLGWDVVPILNENDSVTTEGVTFGNNDFLAAQVAALLEAERLVFLSSSAGVMDDDPRRNPRARLIPLIEDVDALIEELGASRLPEKGSVQGTGGIRGKLRAAQLASLRNIPVMIGSLEQSSLGELLTGDAGGTYVAPSGGLKNQRASFRFWLEHARPSAGTLTVDAGAARAIRDRGASLLGVGIKAFGGDFAAGDAVVIQDQDHHPLAKGICRYSLRELRLLQHSGWQIEGEELEEVVHRDEMVLLDRPRPAEPVQE
jgi:glutamate 5-kinase